ncbi:transporter substrate-binding domain-containing protein [Falsiroseomonas selenitidurans]|uniref:Transporter substrate-binding domain-containing protein n=1 Tax=Falsiroseomonas selenitidurans TaxID=2716335 RepID=A0ABX1DYU2_9PROT|nr:transporter substrate-binding domain-containing protein [Falsiroseomonas selenitidurans]NKC30054.1 transporter substrate-binding domain-containing protein [Falsiroseomonas selenitidurans]
MPRCLLGLLLLFGMAGAAAAQGSAQGSAQGAAPGAASPTLEAVKQRGMLRCGVFGQLPGFSAPDPDGAMRGLDADFCRAVAAAVLGDAERVTYVTAPSVEASLEGLEAGRVDVLSSNLTATASRNAGRNLSPIGVLLYDGQAVLVRADADVANFAQLDGKRICVAAADIDNSQAVLANAAARAGITLRMVETRQSGPALLDGFKAGDCEGVTADAAALATLRATDLPDPAAATLLPERLSREPLTPFVRGGDDRWRQIVAWTLHALVAAEELEVTSAGLEAALHSGNAEIRYLLGLDRGLGQRLGLADTWALQAIRQVGNYGEIFERNLGEGSPIGLDRGLSDLWRRGGLMYPFPFR